MCFGSAPMARERRELVVTPTLCEVQAGGDPDHHQADAAGGGREVHAHGEALRELRQRVASMGAARKSAPGRTLAR